MAKQSRRRSPEADGLEGLDRVIADPKTAPIMRAIAERAKARGEGFGTLAKRFNALHNTKLAHANIATKFDAHNPREKTIESFARILGVSISDLQVIAGASLAAEEVASELELVRVEVLTSLGKYEPTAINDVLAILEDGSDDVKGRIATQSRRATLQRKGVKEYALEAKFDGVLDLCAHRRQPSPNEAALYDLWSAAQPHFEPVDVDAIVALGVGLFRRRGVDTTAMEMRLFHEVAALNDIGERRFGVQEKA